jgi:hypothetical protein
MTHTTLTQRRLCYERHNQGQTYTAIAEQLGLSVSCVRYWARQQRDGRHDLSTQYQRSAPSLLGHFGRVRYVLDNTKSPFGRSFQASSRADLHGRRTL